MAVKPPVHLNDNGHSCIFSMICRHLLGLVFPLIVTRLSNCATQTGYGLLQKDFLKCLTKIACTAWLQLFWWISVSHYHLSCCDSHKHT